MCFCSDFVATTNCASDSLAIEVLLLSANLVFHTLVVDLHSLSMATRVPLRFLRRGVFCIPGPGKERSGGEDAFFCTPTALGVADGVGSWINEGIDPSLYPRKLMSAALNSSLKTPTELAKINEFPPLAILQEAYQAAAKARVLGSSTAVVCSMLDENRLGILNVGDSGIRIVRNGSLLFGSA